MIQQDWPIQGRARRCARTGREFEEGETIYSALHREGEGLRREDFSEEGWEELSAANSAPFSFWRTKYELPPPTGARPESVDKADAETHLRRLLAEGPPPDQAGVAYLLAALLERKRLLRPVPLDPAASSATIPYEHTKTGELFLVPAAPPRLDALDEVQADLAAMLGH